MKKRYLIFVFLVFWVFCHSLAFAGRDRVPPKVSITNPASGTIYTTPQTVTITVSALDNKKVSKVMLYDGPVLKYIWISKPYTYNWTFTSADNGRHNWTAKAEDSFDNTNISSVVSLIVNISDEDTTPPTGSIEIDGGATYANSPSVTLTLSATDSSGISGMCISNTSSCSMWEDYATSKVWTLPTGDGTKTVYVWFKDGAGNVNTSPFLDTIFLDTTSPTISITSPASGTTYTTGQTVRITASASDNGGVSKVEFYDGSTLKGTSTSSPYSYPWTFTGVDSGVHNWTAKAYDASGKSAASGIVNLTVNIDISAPSVPTGLTATAVGCNQIDLSWIASTDSGGSGLKGYNIYCNGSFLKQVLAPSTSISETDLMANTKYCYTVEAYDEAGNTSAQSTQVCTNTLGLYNMPNDPFFIEPHPYLDSEVMAWHIYHINAHLAWRQSKGEGVVVAVLDSGIDLHHSELRNQLWVNPGEIPDNGIDDDLNGYIDDVHGWNFLDNSGDVQDDNGHGTQIAGLIAAEANNGIGFSGIAPGAKIMVLRIKSGTRGISSKEYSAVMHYAINNGAKVINYSAYGSQMTKDLIMEATQAGVVIVAAAGNEGLSTVAFPPGADPRVISVSASSLLDKLWLSSNRGPTVDLSAPAPKLITTTIISDPSAKFINGEAYAILTGGTSFATPVVAGVVALILAKNPSYSPEMVRTALRKSAVDVGPQGFDLLHGYGRVDASAALEIVSPPETKITWPFATVKYSSGDTIPIVGLVGKGAFKDFTLEYGFGMHPASWSPITSSSQEFVTESELVTWEVPPVPNDFSVVTLRLTSRDLNNNTYIDLVPVIVDDNDPDLLMENASYTTLERKILRSPGVGNVDPTSPGLEVFYTACGILHGFHADGNLFIYHHQSSSALDGVPPNIRDLDGDGVDDVILKRNNMLEVLRFDGHSLVPFDSNWPREIWLNGSESNPITFLDLDGDLFDDLLFSDYQTLYGWNRFGQELFSQPGDPVYSSGISIIGPSQLYSDQLFAYVDGLHLDIIDGQGKLVASSDGLSSHRDAEPVVADVDLDGLLEIVTITRPGWMFDKLEVTQSVLTIWDLNAQPLRSWTVGSKKDVEEYFDDLNLLLKASYYGINLVVADVSPYSPGLEIVVSHPNYVYVYDHLGNLLPGWPQDLTLGAPYDFGVGESGAPVVGDLDNDGYAEIIATSSYSAIFAWDYAGNLRTDLGFPIFYSELQMNQITTLGWAFNYIPKALHNSPVLTDLNEDGNIDLVVLANHIYTYTFASPANGNIQWPELGHDSAHSFNYHY